MTKIEDITPNADGRAEIDLAKEPQFRVQPRPDRATPSFKPILCLDFDGVIHSYTSGWKGAAVIPDQPVPGALKFICNAQSAFAVHIFSSRSHQPGGIEAMRAYLLIEFAKHFAEIGGGDWAAAWKAADAAVADLAFPDHKPSATISIDDRAITFTGEWPSIDTLRAFKPWNK
jgi:hypothetical protein